MDSDIKQQMIDQALSLAYNYICTFRPNKAIELVAQILNMDSNNEHARSLFEVIYANQNGNWPRSLHETYGLNWVGESLEGKSIEVFCDQGMGDTINMLRYIKLIKDRWNCRVVLNYYAFFNEMENFMKKISYVDEFTPFHVKCDFVTNILSIPAVLQKMPMQMVYPTQFSILMTTKIPEQPVIDGFYGNKFGTKLNVGVAWKSNIDNPLFSKKSIPVDLFSILTESGANLYSLLPEKNLPDFIKETDITDLADTASLIHELDFVVSVDTAVLHLAGAMGKKTFGLISFDGDERWGYKETNVWYPSVRLFRQTNTGDWSYPLNQIKEELVIS